MHSYRRIPIEVHAFQITPESRAAEAEWPQWLKDAFLFDQSETGAVYPINHPHSDGADPLMVVVNGVAIGVDWGDWLVLGEFGLLPVRDEIFAATYEPA